MIRQAHTYLAGAVSGAALIGAAVVAFVMLVSLQALKDWPLAGIGGGSDGAAVSSGHPAAPTGVAAAGAAAGGVAAGPAVSAGGNATGNGRGADEGRQQVGNAGPGTAPSTGSPSGEAPASNPAGGGGSPGSGSGQSSASGSGAGGGGNGGGSGSPPEAAGTGGGGGGPSTSKAVTGGVDETVSGVDKALGGTLGEVGVTKATEEVVISVAGPESVAGKTVDETVEVVGGLLGGHR